MEFVDFYPGTFYEIPDQDNPAYGDEECLIIVAESKSNRTNAIILHIIPDQPKSMTYISKFPEHKRAVQFCKCFSS